MVVVESFSMEKAMVPVSPVWVFETAPSGTVIFAPDSVEMLLMPLVLELTLPVAEVFPLVGGGFVDVFESPPPPQAVRNNENTMILNKNQNTFFILPPYCSMFV
jgi:hypothetical protein